jgi:AcrR family transcriptional regulator
MYRSAGQVQSPNAAKPFDDEHLDPDRPANATQEATSMQDRRVRRTRRALNDALLSLMTDKGYEAVTVQDLIDRADIGRSTFYAHYTDKADLLREMLSGLRSLIEPEPTTGPADRRRPLRFGLQMFQHVQDQQALLRALLGRPGTGRVVAEIEDMLTDVVRAELQALAEASGDPRVPLDLIAPTVVAGYLAILAWWVGDDFQHTPEQMNAHFQTLLAPGIRAAIPPGNPA